jgi:NAD(P)H-dependent FMN reductase
VSDILDIAVIVGSLRQESLSRKTAKALIERAPAQLKCRFVEIGDLANYNEDLDTQTPPQPWTRFRDEVRACQGVLFVTPEYNRSVPGVLKNAIDVGSRPPGKSVWSGKAAGVVSVTPYKLGAFGANHHLRQAFVFLDMPAMQQPEAYVSNAAALFAEDGSLKPGDTDGFFRNFMQKFAEWIVRARAR